jgi:hypothetical protein
MKGGPTATEGEMADDDGRGPSVAVGQRLAQGDGARERAQRGAADLGLGRIVALHHLLTRFIPDSLSYSVPLFVERQCDRATVRPRADRAALALARLDREPVPDALRQSEQGVRSAQKMQVCPCGPVRMHEVQKSGVGPTSDTASFSLRPPAQRPWWPSKAAAGHGRAAEGRTWAQKWWPQGVRTPSRASWQMPHSAAAPPCAVASGGEAALRDVARAPPVKHEPRATLSDLSCCFTAPLRPHPRTRGLFRFCAAPALCATSVFGAALAIASGATGRCSTNFGARCRLGLRATAVSGSTRICRAKAASSWFCRRRATS